MFFSRSAPRSQGTRSFGLRAGAWASPGSGRRILLLLAHMAVYLAVGPEVYARGQQEDPLAAADRLIAAQSYNEAINYLTEFIRKYPERFDEAQARLKRVIEIRETYNKKAKNLLDTLVNEPTNEEKKLALIKELEALEKKPNKETLDFIARTKEASLFVYNRTRFDEIMSRGRKLIDQKRYAEAALAYQEGFVLYRDEFDSGPYNELTKSAVAALVDRVKAEVASYESSQDELARVRTELASVFRSGDPETVVKTWRALEPRLIAQARRRDSSVLAGRAMERHFEAIKKLDQGTTDSSFLPFAFRFTLGRSSSALPEGIVGAMDSQWIELLNSLESVLEARVDAAYAAAEKAFEEGRFEDAAFGFETVAGLASPGLSFLGLWSTVLASELLDKPSAYGKSVFSGKSLAYERLRHLGLLAEAHGRLSRLAAGLEKTGSEARSYAEGPYAKMPLADALAGFSARRAALAGLGSQLESERPPSRSLAEALAKLSAAGLALESSARIHGSYDGRLSSLIDKTREFEVWIAARAMEVEFADLDRDYRERQAVLAEGRRLQVGIPSPDAPGILLRYPTRSAERLNSEDSELKRLGGRITLYLGAMSREIPYIAGAPSVQVWEEKARELQRGIAGIQSERVRLIASAAELRKSAEAARIEAERRLAEARRALQSEDFEQARDRLDKARERYLASLSFEEDPKLRQASDLELQRLGQEIVRVENDKVIRETRRFITEGKTLYFQASFDRAEDAFLKAKARWRTTNGDNPEPEVEYWLRLVQAALSVKTGRQIPATAPLYPEMSQLLSLAKRHFEDGKRLLSERKKADALQAFALAKQKINEVKVVFPLNEEAGVLALRIDQLTDPDAFRFVFGAKFSGSRAKLETNPREAYSELQDLAAIDPRYPGLKAALDRAEILLGIKIPPPDPAKLRRASELVSAARRIVDSGDRARYPFALEQVNEAIQLDPNNEQAVALKDRLLTAQGGSAQIVLSSAVEAQYQQAVALFQNGDTLGAYAIVQRLLQDPANKRAQKLLELSAKLQARL